MLSVPSVVAGDSPVPHFSPQGGCESNVVAQIAKATNVVNIAMYEFTSKPIAAALTNAVAHGVTVGVILDANCASNSVAPLLKAGGVLVYLDRKHARMHDKYLVVDCVSVTMGSFNYTFTAENKNAESMVSFRDDAQEFFRDWLRHCSHSGRY